MAGWVPWNNARFETLQWFASHLTTDANADPKEVIQEKLLDGRDRLDPFEIEQFLLLFGNDKEVHTRLGREMIDLRVRTSEEKRWDERVETHLNILANLQLATEFIKTHVSVGELTVESLRKTTGTPDYVAIREALVNLFIHQDYSDKRASAQIDIAPGVVTFFNPGFSLVDRDKVSAGVKSQARNPLIARALRLLGFAELAASGLRELQRVWRKAHPLPPRLASDEKTNSFTLVLDWRDVPEPPKS
jgi:predicted HTH transcriptional regulator